ncbi:MAG: PAS domain-containing sensor histidine kinase [Verrucomicrobiota bacterium]
MKIQPALLILLITVGGSFRAAADSPPLGELRTAEQVRRLSAQQADLHYPVRLRGVVTFFDDKIALKSFRFIQDDTAGIYFYVDGSANNPPLHAGQLVELEGVTGAGAFAPVVTSHRIQILGETNLPPAKPISFDELESGREDSQFVEISGVIRAVRFEDSGKYYVLDLATGQGRLTLQAPQLPVARGEQLVDSTVKAKGVCITHFNSQRQLFDISLLIPSPGDLAIEQSAPNDPQAIPEQPINSVMQYSWGSTYGHRVKVAGNVVLRYSNLMYIQDGTNGLCVETKQADKVPVGERVEVLGFPAKGEYAPLLEDGTYRWIGLVPPAKPDLVTPDEVLSGTHDCRLVQIDATLLDRAEHSKEPFLVLQSHGFVFHAYLRSEGQNIDFEQLQNGSKVSVTGVCVIDDLGEDWHSGPDWRAASFRLLLRSPEDVVVLEQPPWWTLPRLLWAIAILCSAVLITFGWVVLLRRRVHQQTQIIEEKLHAEAAIKERYLDLFENANDMVFTHDLTGRMTSINKAGERLLQYQRGEILNRGLIDLITEEQRPAAKTWLQQVMTGVEIPAVDWDFVNANGQRLKLEVSSRMVEQAGRFIEVEGVARDVTARKRMEKEILEISNREQQRLGHNLHDGVCQQLAAIAYRTHILARHLKEKDMVESSEANNISSLINESLVQTRTVARGLFPVRLEEEGLTDAVEELTVNIGKLYNIKCDFSSAGTLPTMHNGVAMHLHFIAQEAIMNAAKHSQASAITVRLLRENDELVLSVKDNGVGFQSGNQDRTGMGIGIMRYRAKVIGAALDLQSQPGQGTQLSCKYHLQS